jgi:hypothetical protein
MLFLSVRALPKGALVEKQVLYHTGRGFSAVDDEGDTTPVAYLPVYETGIIDSSFHQKQVLSDLDVPQKHSLKATRTWDAKYCI